MLRRFLIALVLLFVIRVFLVMFDPYYRCGV